MELSAGQHRVAKSGSVLLFAFMLTRFLTCLLGLAVLFCSPPSPTTSKTNSGPVPKYVWPDSLPHYFPPGAADLPAGTIENMPYNASPVEYGCRGGYEYVGKHLVAFEAPVLCPVEAAAPEVYRFVWLRDFHRPVLLTLTCTAWDGRLRTQFLDKNLTILGPSLPDPAKLGIDKAEWRWRQQKLADTCFMAQYRAAVEHAMAPAQVSDTVAVGIGIEQVQQLRQRLQKTGFWQLASCPPDQNVRELSLADWLLEIRSKGRYHVVYRHNPNKKDEIRRFCELLLDWSPARKEERY